MTTFGSAALLVLFVPVCFEERLELGPPGLHLLLIMPPGWHRQRSIGRGVPSAG